MALPALNAARTMARRLAAVSQLNHLRAVRCRGSTLKAGARHTHLKAPAPSRLSLSARGIRRRERNLSPRADAQTAPSTPASISVSAAARTVTSRAF